MNVLGFSFRQTFELDSEELTDNELLLLGDGKYRRGLHAFGPSQSEVCPLLR